MILQLKEQLFYETSNSIRWPVVQLYRMLFIVVVNTFVLNPVFKSLWFSGVFLLFALHDSKRMPFKNPFLNQLQRLTSVCLFFVNLCSAPSAFSSLDITLIQNMDICLKVLHYFELSLYGVVLLSLPVWKIWEKFNNILEERKKKN